MAELRVAHFDGVTVRQHLQVFGQFVSLRTMVLAFVETLEIALRQGYGNASGLTEV